MILDCYQYYLWTTQYLRHTKPKQKTNKFKKGNKNEQ